MFKKGDIVDIIPDFQDAGDSDFVWVVVEDEEKRRVNIQPHGTGMILPPRYTVHVSQIKLAGPSSGSPTL